MVYLVDFSFVLGLSRRFFLCPFGSRKTVQKEVQNCLSKCYRIPVNEILSLSVFLTLHDKSAASL